MCPRTFGKVGLQSCAVYQHSSNFKGVCRNVTCVWFKCFMSISTQQEREPSSSAICGNAPSKEIVLGFPVSIEKFSTFTHLSHGSFLRKAHDSGFKTNVFSALRNLTQFGNFCNLTSEKHCWQKNSLQVLHKITGELMTLPRAAHTAHLPHPTVAVNTQLTWRRHPNQHLCVCLLPET